MGNNSDFWGNLEKEMGNTSVQGNNSSFLEDGNDVELRTIFMYLVYDVSGSMEGYSETMFDSCVQTCRALSSAQNEDLNFRVKFVKFNNDVKEVNKEFQDPADLAALLTKDDFICEGQTSISKIIDYLDNQFSRDALKARKLHKMDPKSVIVIVTDYQPVGETPETVAIATNKILSNRFYNKANKTLCIFCGEDRFKANAAELAGGLDNVVSMGQEYIQELLTPVLISSTITLSDATHVEGNITETKTTSEIAEKIIKDKKTANDSANELSSKDAQKELRQLLGLN